MTFDQGVTSIGQKAFEGCSNLLSVTFAGTITNIGVQAFQYCASLVSLAIPASVTNLGDGAFNGCASLASVFFAGNAPGVGVGVFGGDNNATAYYLPGSTGWSSPFAGLTAVLSNAQIQTGDGSFGMRTNYFGFNIAGTANMPIVVEACTNLANPVWTPLQTLTLTNGSHYFNEPFQANIINRYYRLILQ